MRTLDAVQAALDTATECLLAERAAFEDRPAFTPSLALDQMGDAGGIGRRGHHSAPDDIRRADLLREWYVARRGLVAASNGLQTAVEALKIIESKLEGA